MELKDVFGEIESDGANLVHGRLLEWALTPPLWHAEAVGGRPHHQVPTSTPTSSPACRSTTRVTTAGSRPACSGPSRLNSASTYWSHSCSRASSVGVGWSGWR